MIAEQSHRLVQRKAARKRGFSLPVMRGVKPLSDQLIFPYASVTPFPDIDLPAGDVLIAAIRARATILPMPKQARVTTTIFQRDLPARGPSILQQ